MKSCIIIPWFNYWRTSNKDEFSVLIRELEKKGFKAYLFDYEERPEDLNDLLNRFDLFINSLDEKEFYLIGYSLGAYISLKYIQKYNSQKIKKILLCCPLILGSRFFRTIYKIWPFWINNSGKVLHDASYEKMDFSLIPKNIDIGVIRGRKRINRRLLISFIAQIFLLGKLNDGLFIVSESDFGYNKITLPMGHYNGPQDPIYISSVINFLKNSKF